MTSLKDILYNIGYVKLSDYGKQYSTRPLYRDSDNDTALTINKETGEWYDFVERVGGPIETLIERTLGKPLTLDLKERLASEEFLPSRRLEVELSFQKIFDKALLFNLIKDNSYWVGRNISSYTLEKFDGGVSVNGRMRNRYVFPIFDNRGSLIGVSGRYLYKSEYVSKWKHLGAKSSWIFPLLSSPEIIATRKVILVESIGDMLSLYEAGVKNVLVVFGVKLSGAIISYLLKLDVQEIYISLNNDSNNKFVGNKAANEFKNTLLNYFDPNQIKIALPTVKNDFGEMKREEIFLWKTENQI